MTRCYATGMALDPTLLDLLACPEDKGPLLYFAADGFLYNPRLKRKYRVDDGVPVMLIDEAQTVSAAEHQAVMAKAAAEGVRPNFS
jgi:uncharacterized protein YbaR (Trm112 family)